MHSCFALRIAIENSIFCVSKKCPFPNVVLAPSQAHGWLRKFMRFEDANLHLQVFFQQAKNTCKIAFSKTSTNLLIGRQSLILQSKIIQDTDNTEKNYFWKIIKAQKVHEVWRCTFLMTSCRYFFTWSRNTRCSDMLSRAGIHLQWAALIL